MNYEISEWLDKTREAVGRRKTAAPDELIPTLRELDEKVCLTSRTLFLRYKSTALLCRSIEQTTHGAVRTMLTDAVNCLPKKDYDDGTDYKVRNSVEARRADFEILSSRLKNDPNRPGWEMIPIDPELQTA